MHKNQPDDDLLLILGLVLIQFFTGIKTHLLLLLSILIPIPIVSLAIECDQDHSCDYESYDCNYGCSLSLLLQLLVL